MSDANPRNPRVGNLLAESDNQDFDQIIVIGMRGPDVSVRHVTMGPVPAFGMLEMGRVFMGLIYGPMFRTDSRQ